MDTATSSEEATGNSNGWGLGEFTRVGYKDGDLWPAYQELYESDTLDDAEFDALPHDLDAAPSSSSSSSASPALGDKIEFRCKLIRKTAVEPRLTKKIFYGITISLQDIPSIPLSKADSLETTDVGANTVRVMRDLFGVIGRRDGPVASHVGRLFQGYDYVSNSHFPIPISTIQNNVVGGRFDYGLELGTVTSVFHVQAFLELEVLASCKTIFHLCPSTVKEAVVTVIPPLYDANGVAAIPSPDRVMVHTTRVPDNVEQAREYLEKSHADQIRNWNAKSKGAAYTPFLLYGKNKPPAEKPSGESSGAPSRKRQRTEALVITS